VGANIVQHRRSTALVVLVLVGSVRVNGQAVTTVFGCHDYTHVGNGGLITIDCKTSGNVDCDSNDTSEWVTACNSMITSLNSVTHDCGGQAAAFSCPSAPSISEGVLVMPINKAPGSTTCSADTLALAVGALLQLSFVRPLH
jgi:hypothetical protein